MGPLHARALTTIFGAALLLGSGCAKDDAKAPLTGAGAGRADARQAQVVEVVELSRRDLAETLSLVGSLAANESAQMRTEIGGIVRGIYFDEGQEVKSGDLLLKIDDAELRAQAAQVEARYNLAQLNVTRSENLSQSRTIPQSEVDRARSEFSAAEAERSLIRLRLEKTEIRAPFDGVVGSRDISPGDYVTPTTVITTINDLSRLKITFEVPERFLTKVRPGTSVRVTTRATTANEADQVLDGEVYFVSSTIDRAVRASEVKALLQHTAPGLRPGMFANIALILERKPNVLTVPEGAILTNASGIQIITVDESGDAPVAAFVTVKTGLRTSGLVEIMPQGATLAEGTKVVASGVGALILFPGAPLDPRPIRAAFGGN
ncbi:efflux RND transporter periplasmic adaptor subunit [Synoicihabitans lomoniglobus]|uniref:Efflux RND transporter periplasmic adaptor subunit n=1 Tax=Synoicihabitans lomoniglobus TaxID=2909285 RepID=A0AAF0I4Y0_9BACT|nr:efflux RND transporter periplasmic adaptor subunit [Opitutaceae bacterium LMO-M01]WED66735.1 efflux RND transporter periplasmic adaptor subunit [Opitutaceae bacterium LMO-M01]